MTGATLARFFALHVVVLPFAALALLGAHLLLVQKHGMSVPPGVAEAGRPRPFFPDFLLRDLVGWTLALALLAALAALLPGRARPEGQPLRLRAARHQARVVLLRALPAAQVDPRPTWVPSRGRRWERWPS